MAEAALADQQTWWEKEGYLLGRELGDGLWLLLRRMLFTVRVTVADEMSCYQFCCFENMHDAVGCWATWDGNAEPPGPYTRYHR